MEPAVGRLGPRDPGVPPDQVPAVQAVRGDQSADVSWTAPNPQGCAITGYTITNSQGASMTVGGNATSATFAGLTNGTPYTFTVVATNEEGDSPASAPSNAGHAGRPAVPDDDHAGGARRRPGLRRWAAANDNGSPIVRYELSVNGGGWENVGNVCRRREVDSPTAALHVPGPRRQRRRSRCRRPTPSAPAPRASPVRWAGSA